MELQRRKAPAEAGAFLKGCRRRPTLPRPLGRSTIGAAGLNDRVRNGNGCDPCALVTGKSVVSSGAHGPVMRRSVGGRLATAWRMGRGVRAPPERWCRKRRIEVVVECGRAVRGALHFGALLGFCSLTGARGSSQATRAIRTAALGGHRGPSTGGLSTSSSPTALQEARGLGRVHLGACFPLRCFQRLSQPAIATRRCPWRDNRDTSGPSDSVLSY